MMLSSSGSDPGRPGGGPGRIAELEAEVAQLKEAIAARAVVDQAIGVLAAVARLAPEGAWDVLREVSGRTHTKIRAIAEQLVQWPRTGDLAEPVRAEIARRLACGKPDPRSTHARR